MDILDKNNNIVLSTPANEGSILHYDLMGEHFIQLNFALDEPVLFTLGMYVIHEGIKYEITEIQKPVININTGGYEYRLKLDAYYRKWKNKILKYTPENAASETDWALTASLSVHASIVVRNLTALGYTYNGTAFEVSIDSSVTSDARYIQYSNQRILDALTAMAEAFDCEWWVTDNIIHFGKCEYGSPVNLEMGVNVQNMTRSESKADYFTRLYVFGSDRNIPSNYRESSSGVTVNGIVQKRLMLPVGTPYIDADVNQTQDESIEGVVFFDDVYPKTTCAITDVTTYTDTADNEDGTTTIQTFYRIKQNRFNFSQDYILEGKELRIVFESGKLSGMDFGVAFNPLGVAEKDDSDNWNPEAQLFEIIVNSDYGRELPDSVLYPEVGDTFVLYGWDSTKIEELGLVSDAEQELYQRGLDYIQKTKIDPSTYNVTVMSDNAFDGLVLEIGDRVNLINQGFFENGRVSRVIGYEFKLDLPYDNPLYVIGESAAYSRIGALESQVNSIIYNGSEYNYSSGSGVYVIGTRDRAIATDRNVYSAKMSDNRFLRKDIDDVAKGLIDSLKGFQVGADFVSGLLGEGGIFRKEADGNTYIETDRLYVRMKAYFDEIEVKKYTHSGGNRIASKTGIKTVKVEWLDENDNVTENDNEVDKYRCYFRLSDDDGNTTTNDWVVGDLARSQEFNIGSNGSEITTHGYWRAVVGVGSTADDDGLGYIDLSKRDCLQGSDVPQAQDDIIQLGNNDSEHHSDRQGAIIEYSTGANAPSYQIYQGINGYNLNGKNYVTLGYNSSTGKAELIVYGDAFIGNQNGSHIQYNSTTGELTIKATIDAQSTIGNQSLEEYIQEHQTTWTEQEIETLITDSTSEQFADIDTAIDTLKKQADGAIETWFYNGVPTLSNEPASTWNTTELKDRHLGDLYYDNQSGYAYRFTKTGSTYSWNQISDSAVAKALSDAAAAQTTANSKRRIFFVTPTPPYEQGDLWVNATYPANNTYTDATNNRYYNDVLRCKTTKASGSFSISDWTLASKYTDDSKFNSYIDQLLNHTIISNPSDAQQVANTYNSVMQALNQGTIIEGGLVLSTLIGLRDSNNKVWAGISGAYNTQAKGKGIASWYGGAMVDWETLSDAQKQAAQDGDYAKSLFRMDGTGYVASGNISWDSLGRVTLKNLYTDTGKNIDQLLALFSIGGTIPTNAYITPAYPFSSLEVLVNGSSVNVATALQQLQELFEGEYENGTLVRIKAKAALYSIGEVSALGYDDSGGGGGGGGTDLAAVWTTLTGNTGTYKDYQIHSGHLTSALANYALSSSLATVATSGSYNDLSDKPTIPAAQIQSDWNQTTTTAKDYIKNKPTKLSQFTNDANYVTSSSLSTTLASYVTNSSLNTTLASYATQTWVTNKGYATTSAMNAALEGYLPLTGGTLTGRLTTRDVGSGWGNGFSPIYSAITFPAIDDNLYHPYLHGTSSDGSVWNLGGYQTRVGIYGYFAGHTENNTDWRTWWNTTNGYLTHSGGMEVGGAVSMSSTLGVAGLLTASGNIKTASYIEIGDYRIVADTANTALKVVNKDGTTAVNFYATGENSALGVNTSGGGGGGDGASLEAVWTSLGSSTGTYGSSQINASHLTSALNGYATQTWVEAKGYLTSYTETDPVFTASAAHGITSANITSWNNKVSNVQADWNATSGLAVILNKPTNLVTTSAMNTALNDYLPLAGGTMTNTNVVTNLNADLLDGVHLTSLVRKYPQGNYDLNELGIEGSMYRLGNSNTNAFTSSNYGNVLVVGVRGADTCYQLGAPYSVQKLYFRTGSWHSDGGTIRTNPWKEVAFTDSNVASATILATARTIWGQSFDGSANVSGDMTGVGSISASDNISVRVTNTDYKSISVGNSNGVISLRAATNRGILDDTGGEWLIATNGTNTFLNTGNVGIGTTSPSYKLHVDGNTYTSALYLASTSYIDTNSNNLRFYSGGLPMLMIDSTDLAIRRTNAAEVTDTTLGTSSYRWANMYSVLGNFSGQITSSVATGTSPLHVASTTLNTNLNADLLDGIHASGLFTQLTNDGDDISVTIGGTNKALTVGYASKSKKAGDSWTSVVTIGEWSKVLKISSYAAVLLSVRLDFSFQSANVTYLINNAYNSARIVQIGTGGYTSNSNFDIRITRSGTTTIDVEIKTSYAYQSATTQNVVCHAVNIHNSGTLTPYTSYTAGSGTLVDSFTSYSRYSFIGKSLRLNGGSTSTTSPDLYIAGTSWFAGAIKVGNAYIWWDDTNSCLRITGANSSGTPVASVAVNVNVSGEVSALKTS